MAYVGRDKDECPQHRQAPSHNLEVDAKPNCLKWQLPGQTFIIPATTVSPPLLQLDDTTPNDSSRSFIRKRDSHRRHGHEGPKTATDRLLVSGSSDHRRGPSRRRIDSVDRVPETQNPRVDSVFDVDIAEPGEAEKVAGGVAVCSGALPTEPVETPAQERNIKAFTLPITHVDTIDLRSVRCPRLRWREKIPARFVVNVLETGRARLRRHTATDRAASQAGSPAQRDVDLNDKHREAEDLRRWLRTYGDDRQWGTMPFGS